MPYLGHGDGALLGEGVVVKVDDAQVGVVLHGAGQRSDPRVIDAVLGHVDLLQTANQLQRKGSSISESWLITAHYKAEPRSLLHAQ